MGSHPLKDFRVKNELTQAGLAKLLGVSRSYVNRVEAGTRQVGPDRLPAISEKTGIPKATLRPDLADLLQEAAE